MNVLVIGSGGREHALTWKIAQSPMVDRVYCAPGNAGIATIAECVDIPVTDLHGLRNLAEIKGIDLTIVGPELPLTLGIVDLFEEAGLKIFGPNRRAAEIEGSKVFAKRLMDRYGIPSASYEVFTDREEAKGYLQEIDYPVVVKADGLAGGKGAIVCHKKEEAINTIDTIMGERIFGDAGSRVVVEEYLVGEEASFIVATDGRDIIPFPSSQDHKAVFDGDKGPNTGGMGAYSPAPVITPEMERKVMGDIILPTLRAMEKEGRPYRGFLYAGLMITEDGPKVLEFNCRMGDPETQPILMRMKSDLISLIIACLDGSLGDMIVEWDERASVCVIMASKGYPGSYEKGLPITGLEDVEDMEGVMVFHSGTSLKDGRFLTAGGRVLGVTALGPEIKDAIERTYSAVEKISWDGVHFRKDIGAKALLRE